MNARLAAALVAVSFALAMCQPRLGIVVHRHAGGGRTHVHVGETGHGHDDAAVAHRHGHGDHDHAHDDHHNELAAFRVDPPPPPPDDVSLSVGGFAHAWHTHASHPFQHAALPVPPIVAAPVDVARLVLLPPPHRGDAAPIPGRSRAPPSVQSS